MARCVFFNAKSIPESFHSMHLFAPNKQVPFFFIQIIVCFTNYDLLAYHTNY